MSWADTVEMLACCNQAGIDYINTELECPKVDENEKLERFTLLERFAFLEENRHRFTNIRAILCSGMNPGVVQWMAWHMMRQTPGEMPLACYIVEHDTGFFADPKEIKPETFIPHGPLNVFWMKLY